MVISPDGGSSDIKEHQKIAENGGSVICLDHHPYDKQGENEYCNVINVQDCDYPDPSLTGAGVVYKFCEAYNELIYNEPSPDWLLDLVALGNSADMASYLQNEIRAFINLGYSNIQNKLLDAMIKKNWYTIDKRNGINYLSLAFGITPFLNALSRSGTMEEKQLIFAAMLTENENKLVPSSKRGHKGEKVSIIDEAVLVADRVKRRQTKLQDEAMELILDRIKEQRLNDNAYILVQCDKGEIAPSLAGLVANKLSQGIYQKPIAVLTKCELEDGSVTYSGSVRNYNRGLIEDLKAEEINSGYPLMVAGHASAHGLTIKEEDVPDFIDYFNTKYGSTESSATYWVDYIWTQNTIENDKVLDIGYLDIYGQDIPQSLVCVKDIDLNTVPITLMSPDKNPTIKIEIDGLAIIKFKSSKEEFEYWTDTSIPKILTLVGTCAANEWNGSVTPQILIEDYEIKEEWIF